MKFNWKQKLFDRFDFSQVKDRAEHRYLTEEKAHAAIIDFIENEVLKSPQEKV